MTRRSGSAAARGFTIVELLIVVVVIAILATVTVVAYNGIRDRAQQSANLETLDQFEKGVRMYQSDTGSMPVSLTSQEYNDMINSNNVQMAELGQATTDFQNGISRTSPVTVQFVIPSCVPGNYPAGGVFRVGECMFVATDLTIANPHLEAHMRIAYVASTTLANQIAPKYLASMPLLNGEGFGFVSTVTNGKIVLRQDVDSVRGDGTVTYAFRGAQYIGGGTSVAYVVYYAKGDQTCGRGQKQLLGPSDLQAELTASLHDNGIDSDSASTLISTVPSGGQWTQCSITIQ